ncbi:hypothetical protein GCM10010435_91270 [Winogradskya consettensis]|uniref:Uncharacterized protein n=1 Tax=Winogradskya consettensis TaxID=113560 RepID=A0A919SKI9_9ACTN|nr:hypothetical protein Aco04nite_34840 [Actinoplanes consettensis]
MRVPMEKGPEGGATVGAFVGFVEGAADGADDDGAGEDGDAEGDADVDAEGEEDADAEGDAEWEAEREADGTVSGRAGTVGIVGSVTKRGPLALPGRELCHATVPVTSRTASAEQATTVPRRLRERPGRTGRSVTCCGIVALAEARNDSIIGGKPGGVWGAGGTQPPTRSSVVCEGSSLDMHIRSVAAETHRVPLPHEEGTGRERRQEMIVAYARKGKPGFGRGPRRGDGSRAPGPAHQPFGNNRPYSA